MKKRAFFGEYACAVAALFTVLSGAETALGQQEREMDVWKADPSDLSLAVTQVAPALAVEQIPALDANGVDLDDDAARPQRRVGHLLVAEDVGAACLVVHRSAHGATLPSGDEGDLDQPLGSRQRRHREKGRGGEMAVQGAVALRHDGRQLLADDHIGRDGDDVRVVITP